LEYKAFGDEDMKEWERLMDSLEDFWLSEEADKFVWLLDKSGNYTTRSMYRRLTFRGADNKRMQKPWKSILPNKIEVFVWLVTQDRLQTGVNLKKKERKGGIKTVVCVGLMKLAITFAFIAT
jgi:hypothetical protein